MALHSSSYLKQLRTNFTLTLNLVQNQLRQRVEKPYRCGTTS